VTVKKRTPPCGRVPGPAASPVVVLALVPMLLLASCRVKPDPISRFLPALEPVDFHEPGWHASMPVQLIADCQLHNPYSLPIPDRSLSIKMLADTAIRPPQLDMFNGDVLRWVVTEGSPGTEAILHLGDAIDLACEGEWAEFLDAMRSTRKPWLMVPGNHEFFYFGSYIPREDTQWEDACHGAGRPITKDRFVRLYVAALLAQDDPGMQALARSLGLFDARDQDPFALADRIPDRHSWEAPEGTGGFLQAIVWNIVPERPWQSFILQRADLTGRGREGLRINAILMDSNQYEDQPALAPNAWDNYLPELNCGLTGELLSDQLRIVREWVTSEEDRGWLMAIHHPLDSMSSKARSSLVWLWARHIRGGLLSAHTHAGRYVKHELGNGREGLELNVGSTLDWPMEWRNMVIHARKDGLAYMESERFVLVERLRNRKGYFLPGWEVPAGAADDYRGYSVGIAEGVTLTNFVLLYHFWPPPFGRPMVPVTQSAIATETRIKDTMLRTYARLIRTFPTDPEAAGTAWPDGCRTDAEVLARIEEEAGRELPFQEKIALQQDTIKRKIDFLQALERFEKTRGLLGAQGEEEAERARRRYKLSQAVWASRYEIDRGRNLRPEDTLIRSQSNPVDPEVLQGATGSPSP